MKTPPICVLKQSTWVNVTFHHWCPPPPLSTDAGGGGGGGGGEFSLDRDEQGRREESFWHGLLRFYADPRREVTCEQDWSRRWAAAPTRTQISRSGALGLVRSERKRKKKEKHKTKNKTWNPGVRTRVCLTPESWTGRTTRLQVGSLSHFFF